jgi:hypothetical protein
MIKRHKVLSFMSWYKIAESNFSGILCFGKEVILNPNESFVTIFETYHCTPIKVAMEESD